MYKMADRTAMDLMKRLLDVNPKTRMSAAEALHHPYFDFNRL
jgi:serine/threonine protein kinase